MKKLNYFLLLSLLLMQIVGCQKEDLTPASDKDDLAFSSLKAANKPAPNLRGEIVLAFNLDYVFGEPDPFVDPVWFGTIDIEGYDEYDMRFYPRGEDKGFSQASPFEEYFEISDKTTGDIVLAGHDAGVTTLANKPPDPNKYRMNGEIEVANAPFEAWMGSHVHISGLITWVNLGTAEEPVVVPETAVGPFRVN